MMTKKKHKTRNYRAPPTLRCISLCRGFLSELAKQQEVGTGYLRPLVFWRFFFFWCFISAWRYGRPQTHTRGRFVTRPVFGDSAFVEITATTTRRRPIARVYDCRVWSVGCIALSGVVSWSLVDTRHCMRRYQKIKTKKA